MGDFRKTRDPKLRREILYLLHLDKRYNLTLGMLKDALNDRMISVSRNEVEYQLQWLEDHRLVTITRNGDTIFGATLTDEGKDVVTGDSMVTGVQRPQPGDLAE